MNNLLFSVMMATVILPAGVILSADTVAAPNITTVVEFGKDVDWHPKLNRIASARVGKDGYYDVFTMKPDGSDVRVLTDALKGCPQKHNGNVAFHPSGEFLVYTGQDERLPDEDRAVKRAAVPGSGLGANLCVVGIDGLSFHPLTAYPLVQPFRAVIHPQFSKDGKKLAWTERVRRGNSFGGGWVIKIADFTPGTPPVLQNVQTLEPGDQDCFYETHDFSNDGTRLLISGNLKKGQIHTGLDLYEMDIASRKVKRLTHTADDWDEHAHYSPDGTLIAWMSSTGYAIDYGLKEDGNSTWELNMSQAEAKLKTELWIMNADGSNARQITHFNTPGHPEYLRGANCIVADSTWAPDGKSIVACVFTIKGQRRSSRLVRIELP